VEVEAAFTEVIMAILSLNLAQNQPYSMQYPCRCFGSKSFFQHGNLEKRREGRVKMVPLKRIRAGVFDFLIFAARRLAFI
jgi:hypothetical protein